MTDNNDTTEDTIAKGSSENEEQQEEGRQIESLVESVLKLEYIDQNLYRSIQLWRPLHARGVFGGQVIGQALSAATMTVQPHQKLHSIHCYFILPGDSTFPILYHVDILRDGKSYATRTVTATQKSRCIFSLTASFAVPEQGQPIYQVTMPKVPSPDELPSIEDRYRRLLKKPGISSRMKSVISNRIVEREESPMEIRHIDKTDIGELVGPIKQSNKGAHWFRARGTVVGDDAIHKCVLAYMSDSFFIGQAARATGLSFTGKQRLGLMVSLDHSMWFHSDFRADEWLLYEIESPRVANGRGFVQGRVWNQKGQLVVSVAQEGVIRQARV